MADRPFRGGGYGGRAPLGEGINEGVNSFVQNYLAMKRQQTMDKYATVAERNQAVTEGSLRGQNAPMGQPPVDAGGGGAAVLATAPAAAPPSPAEPTYIKTQPGVPLPLGNSTGHPHFTQAPGIQPGVGQFPGTSISPNDGSSPDLPPGSSSPFTNNYKMTPDPVVQAPPFDMGRLAPQSGGPTAASLTAGAPSATPPPMLMAQAGPGAQALASDKPVEQMSLDELRQMSFDHAKNAREEALKNETNTDMLSGAYHYKQLMNTSKPYLDQWAKALNEVKANPQNPDKWRGVQVLTGEEDPQKALSMATNEYSKLRGQHEEYSKNYEPMNEHLTKNGITPDQYDNDAKFLQFRNAMKFQPHTPTGRGAGVLKTPKTTRR